MAPPPPKLSAPLAFLFLALPISSFSLQTLAVSSGFGSGIELRGDAALSEDGSRVQITRPSAPSSGLLLHSAPIRLATPISFSADFTFSISPGAGDGLALVLFSKDAVSTFGSGSFGLPNGYSRFVGVEFDTSVDEDVRDPNANHVGIDLGSFASVSVSNASSMKLLLNSGEKLRSWVDYSASSKRLEVRLSRFTEPRPYDPILAHSVDFSKVWSDKEEEVLIGISSSNRNSAQTSTVYSWRFGLSGIPHSMHSMPADPSHYKSGEHVKVNTKKRCAVVFVGGLVLMALLGAMLLSVMLNLCAIVVEAFRAKHPCGEQADFRYEKIDLVIGKDGMK